MWFDGDSWDIMVSWTQIVNQSNSDVDDSLQWRYVTKEMLEWQVKNTKNPPDSMHISYCAVERCLAGMLQVLRVQVQVQVQVLRSQVRVQDYKYTWN